MFVIFFTNVFRFEYDSQKEDNEEIRLVGGWKLDWPDDNDNIALNARTVNKDVGGDDADHHQLHHCDEVLIITCIVIC